MDFVTITDHDTIAGVLEIADRPDVFVSEELTAHFRGEPQAVHVLCYGIYARGPRMAAGAPRRRGAVRRVPARARDRVRAGPPLLHRRRAADRAPPPPPGASCSAIWEIRNGARARELNRPAATYIATRDGIGIGGSDDHAGVDIGRTYTEAPAAAHARRSSSRTSAPARAAPAARRAAPRSGPTPRSRSPRARWAAASDGLRSGRESRPAHGDDDGRSACCARATRATGRRRATSRPRTPAACCARG